MVSELLVETPLGMEVCVPMTVQSLLFVPLLSRGKRAGVVEEGVGRAAAAAVHFH